MGSKAMDPDRFQMRDLKRRIKGLEDQRDYMKADHRRGIARINSLEELVARLEQIIDELHEKK